MENADKIIVLILKPILSWCSSEGFSTQICQIFSGRDSIEMVEFSAKMILGQTDGISDFVKIQIRVVIIGIQIVLGQCNTR